MGVIPTEVLIKTAIEGGINDLKKNQWVIPDIVSWYSADFLSRKEYGYNEIEAFIKFILSNKFPVYLDFRLDSPEFPCITISSMPRVENESRAVLADFDEITTEATPLSNNIIYVYEPFTPKGYNPQNGFLVFPENLNTSKVAPGQFLVSSSGKAYPILGVVDEYTIRIKTQIIDDFKTVFVIPIISAFNVHRESTFVNESVIIGIHAAGNPLFLTWTHDLIWYVLLRCKEAFLEARGFELSAVRSEPPFLNESFPADRIFTRNIILSGSTRFSWVKFKAPRLDVIHGPGILIQDAPKTLDAYLKMIERQGWKMKKDSDNQ